METCDSDLFVFAETRTSDLPTWKLLIVDDDLAMHRLIKTAAADCTFEDKEVSLLGATSVDAAFKLINDHPDIAVVFLDLNMEETGPGLKFVKYLREELKNHFIRIIVCTGADIEKNIIFNYDINDYLEKTAITPKNLFSVLAMALRSYNHLKNLEKSQQELRDLVKAASHFVPRMILKILRKNSIVDIKLSDHVEKEMTILFLDIRSFTSLSEFATPLETFEFINHCMGYLESAVDQHNGFIDKYIGDAIMAVFPDSADDAVKASIKMLQLLDEYNYTRIMQGDIPIKIGIGINTGLAVLGVVGFSERMDCTVIGDTVNVAERVEKTSKTFSSHLLISEQTLLALKEPGQFNYRALGKVHVSGKKQLVRVYEIFDADPAEIIITLKQKTKADFEQALDLFQASDFIQARDLFKKVYNENPRDLAAKYFIKEITTLIA